MRPKTAHFVLRWMFPGELAGRVLREARSIMRSPDFKRLRTAHDLGKELNVAINGRNLAYEPGVPAWLCGMTLDNGFVLGPSAFRTETELLQTVLQELYRLNAGQAASGASSTAVGRMTDEARSFAARERQLLRWAVHRRM